jgi:hypothetical protein
MRKPWVMAVVAAALVIIGASTVAAAKPVSGTGRQVVERTITVAPPAGSDDLKVDEVVTCPADTASVNGGFAWVTPPSGQGTERRVTGGPEDANWRVVFSTLVDPDPLTITLWAICVDA